MKTSNKGKLRRVIESEAAKQTLGFVSSPSSATEIAIDIGEEKKRARALGQMVCTLLQEDGQDIVSIGQIYSMQTKNRWHEDLSFKGVIKRYGHLPNLSGEADNHLASISVQSSFADKETPEPHTLGVSPSTGGKVVKVSEKIMSALVAHHRDAITYIGHLYGDSTVPMPMWFKHFKGDLRDGGRIEYGANDVQHIGVFGKTGSGKTVASSLMLLGYAKNKKSMNILVLDPQGQFAQDNKDLLPGNKSLKKQIKFAGMKYESKNLAKDICLPNDAELFSALLFAGRFFRLAFGLTTDDKQEFMRENIAQYIKGREKSGDFIFGAQEPLVLLEQILMRFLGVGKHSDRERDKYIRYVYSSPQYQDKLRDRIGELLKELQDAQGEESEALRVWRGTLSLFSSSEGKISMDELVEGLVSSDTSGERRFVVLDLRPVKDVTINDNLQAIFLGVVERKMIEAGEELYRENKKANCLVVMDEAHRFVAKDSPDPRVRELAKEIVDAVRTTRKYGIGHMFITQSLASISDEVIKQLHIYAFGFGLTTGSELRKIREIVNDDAAIRLYRSFADPNSNKRRPFMFKGPMSPLSASGSPLFVEMYTNFDDFEKHNPTSKENKK